MKTLREIQKAVHANACAKGFYDGAVTGDATISMRLALIHSEVSEALEELRECRGLVTTIRADGKPEGFASELADVVIRVLDLAEWLGIDLQDEVLRKHAFNTTRPAMHGKSF